MKPLKSDQIAAQAADLVSGDRENTHGDKLTTHTRIARLWNAWMGIRKAPTAPLTAHDVAIMMMLLKAARGQSGAYNPDNGVDMVGYGLCAAEIEAILCGNVDVSKS